MGRKKYTRAESEAVAKRVIHFYQNEAGKSSLLTWLHFKAQGVPKTTVYDYIKKYGDSGEVKYKKNPGYTPKVANPELLARLQNYLMENPSATVTAIAKEFSLSRSYAKYVKEAKLGIGMNSQAALKNKGEPLDGHHDSGNSKQGESDPSVRPTSPPVTEDINGGCDWDGDDHDNVCEGTEFSSVEGEENDTGARCFICDVAKASKLKLSFPSSAQSLLPAEVDKSAGVIWFLKTVLEVKSEDLSKLLEDTTGINPSEWGIDVCPDPECKGAVEKAFHVWSELKRLESELKRRREGILERVRRCLIDRGSEWDDVMLNERVREVVLGGKSLKLKPEVEAVPKDASEPDIKMEVEDQDFNDFDHFLNFGDLSNVSDEQLQDLVKSELSDEVYRRRSSRSKRGIDKFKCNVPEVSTSRNALAKRTKNLNPRNVKGNKSGKKAIASISDKMYSCQSCPLLEKMDIYMFTAHLAFHSRNAYKCTECNFHFKSNENGIVQKHWEEHHPQLLKSDSPRVVHVTPAEAAGKVYPCLKPNCKLQFGSADERNEHNRKHKGSGWSPKLSCSICSSLPQFRNRMELRLHKAIDHPEEDGMFSCCYCDAKFEHQSEKDDIKFLDVDQLKKHICEAHGQGSYVSRDGKRKARFLQTCPICGLVICSINYTKLDRHLVQEHGRKLYETYTCPICAKQMRYSDAWPHTKKSHWPDAPKTFMCQFCGKGFRSKEYQKTHEDIHRNQESKPYQCELCGASFSVSTYLYIHRRVTHQGRVFPSVLLKKAAALNKALPSSSENNFETSEDGVAERGERRNLEEQQVESSQNGEAYLVRV